MQPRRNDEAETNTMTIQVTKRSERTSHLPSYNTHPVFYHTIQKLNRKSKKGDKRTNLIEQWKKNTP